MKIPAILVCALLISACAHTSVYEVVARELSTVYFNGALAYSASWRPIGSEGISNLTAEEQAALAVATSACIDELEARVAPAAPGREPDKIVATAQVIACMRAKSWSLTIDEVIVTR